MASVQQLSTANRSHTRGMGIAAAMIASLVGAIAIVLVLLPTSATTTSDLTLSTTNPQQEVTADDLPDGLFEAYQAALEGEAYAARAVDNGALLASNPAHDFTTRFDTDTVAITTGTGADLTLALIGYGVPGDVTSVASAAPLADGQTTTFDRGALTEWYRNAPNGLEQGFTLLAPTFFLAANVRSCASSFKAKRIAKWRR